MTYTLYDLPLEVCQEIMAYMKPDWLLKLYPSVPDVYYMPSALELVEFVSHVLKPQVLERHNETIMRYSIHEKTDWIPYDHDWIKIELPLHPTVRSLVGRYTKKVRCRRHTQIIELDALRLLELIVDDSLGIIGFEKLPARIPELNIGSWLCKDLKELSLFGTTDQVPDLEGLSLTKLKLLSIIDNTLLERRARHVGTERLFHSTRWYPHRTIPEKSFRIPSMESLISLDSSSNDLTSLDWVALPNLLHLNISDNAIRRLPELRKYIPKIQSLELYMCGLLDLAFLANLTELSVLDIRSNMLQSSAELLTLPRLRKLHLDRNYLHSIYPVSLCLGLEVLTFSNNFVTSIPSLSIFPRLRLLDASFNRVDTIKESEIPLLEVLHLEGNRLSYAPVLKRPTRLKLLYLSDNPGFHLESLDTSEMVSMERIIVT